MKRICILTGLAFLTFLSSPDVSATVRTQVMTFEAPAAPGLTTITEIAATPETPQIIQGEEIAYAEVRFYDDLTSGTEIELWAAKSDSTSVDSTLGRSVWITDQRTGSLVRFDVTRIVRAWEAGDLPNHGFVIRVVDQVGSGSSASAAFSTPSSLELRYHTGPKPIELDRPSKGGREKERRHGEKQN